MEFLEARKSSHTTSTVHAHSFAVETKRNKITDFLEARLQEERVDSGAFSRLPFHYVELSQNLLQV